MSIASEITRINTNIASAYTACSGKGATMPQTQNSANLANTINSISQGNTPVEKKDVNFYDCDGTLLHAYTKAEFLALEALPELPTRAGLTCQGWNKTLSGMQTYVTNNNQDNAGATYITADRSTKLYLFVATGAKLPDLKINVYMDPNSSATVDWGDGTTGALNNTSPTAFNDVCAVKNDYQAVDEDTVYCVRIIGGRFSLGKSTGSGNTLFNASPVLLKAEIGENCHSISANAFNGCYSLKSVIIPQNVTSMASNTFYNCYSLKLVIIPQNVTSIGNSQFYDCNSLTLVIFPHSITDIYPNSFYDCGSLESVVLPHGVTKIWQYSFSNCSALTSAIIPHGNIVIDSGVFSNCNSLTSIVIPQGVTSIGTYAFSNCQNLYSVDLSAITTSAQIPSLSNSNAFPNTVTAFYVRDLNMAAEFASATNWSAFASKFVVKE